MSQLERFESCLRRLHIFRGTIPHNEETALVGKVFYEQLEKRYNGNTPALWGVPVVLDETLKPTEARIVTIIK